MVNMLAMMIITAILKINGWLIPWWIWAVEAVAIWTGLFISICEIGRSKLEREEADAALRDALRDIYQSEVDDGK